MDTDPQHQSEMTAPSPISEPAAAPAPESAPPNIKASREPRCGRSRCGGPGASAAGRAHAIDVPADAPRLHGVVVSRQEKFGFVKAQETEARYFFHVRDTDGVATHGAQVTFVVARDRTAGKDVAYDVVTVAERPRGGPTAAARPPTAHAAKGREERLPGTFNGVVAAVPRGPAAVRIDDGMIVFTDGAGMQQQALFGGWRLAPGGPPPGLGETVEFGLVRNTATGVFKATSVRLANTAALAAALASAHAALAGLAAPPGAALPPTALPPPSGRQLGRVALLKKEFGFIRQVARPGDLFFHFSQLDGIAAGEIRTGDDVEFSVVRDRDGKLSAAAVRRAAPGTVVFDTVGAETLEGVVLEKPLVTKQYVQSSGALEYDVDSAEADGTAPGTAAGAVGGAGGPQKRRIVFAAGDCVGGSASLRPGDHVTFRVATNIAAAAAAAVAAAPGAAQLAGRRAVEVAPVVCAGKVASVYTDRKFGFIICPLAGGGVGSSAGGGGDAPASSAPASDAGAGAAGSEAGAEEAAAPAAAPAAEEEKTRNGEGTPAPAAEEEEKKDGPTLSTVSSSSESGIAPTEASDISAASKAPTAPSTATAAGKPRRVFFHFSEVSGGLSLRVGDEVAFVLHSNLKNGELNASRVRRTKAAPESPVKPAKPAAAASTDPPAPAANPNKLRLTGNLQSGEHKTQYTPVMPDGTKGFTFDRTKGLEAAAAAIPEGRPFAFFAGLPLKGVGKAFAAALSVQAKPFIPRAESMNKLNLAGAT